MKTALVVALCLAALGVAAFGTVDEEDDVTPLMFDGNGQVRTDNLTAVAKAAAEARKK